MKHYILPLLVAALLVGCESKQEAEWKTQRSATHPDVVATLPDGREVKRIEVVNPNTHNHFVYFIERADVTTNHEVSSGKTTRNQVTSSFGEY